MKSSHLINLLKRPPPDVEHIIADHHAFSFDGGGFPRNLSSSQLSPLSCIFSLSEHLVDFLFDSPKLERNRLYQFLNLYQDQYNTGNFKKVVEALTKGFKI